MESFGDWTTRKEEKEPSLNRVKIVILLRCLKKFCELISSMQFENDNVVVQRKVRYGSTNRFEAR